MPNPNLQSPPAKETAGSVHHPAAPPVQKPATHALPQQPPQQPAHRPPVSLHQISRDEHQIRAREMAKQQQERARLEQQIRLDRLDPAQMEKAVQRTLEQAHREQQQHQHVPRSRESQQHPQPAVQPRSELPPHMRAEQLPYARVEGFGSQVSPHARVPTPQQNPDIHTAEKKGTFIIKERFLFNWIFPHVS